MDLIGAIGAKRSILSGVMEYLEAHACKLLMRASASREIIVIASRFIKLLMFRQQTRFHTGETSIEIPFGSPTIQPSCTSPQSVKDILQPLSTPCRLLSVDLMKSLELESPTYGHTSEKHPFTPFKTTASTVDATPMLASRLTDPGTPSSRTVSRLGDVQRAKESLEGSIKHIPAENNDEDMSTWTTVMLKNIPNKYDDAMLAEEICRRGLGDAFSYIYAVPDPRTGLNRGYAFIDLKTHELACEFMNKFEGVQLPSRKSCKVCACMWANKQGARSPADVGASVGGGLTANGDAWLPPGEALHNKSPGISSSHYIPDGDAGVTRVDSFYSGSMNSTFHDGNEPINHYKLFVGGLGPRTTSRDLEVHFSQFGVVKECAVVKCKATGASRGFGFCQMQSEDGFQAAFSEHSHLLNGRPIGVRRYDYSVPLTTRSSVAGSESPNNSRFSSE